MRMPRKLAPLGLIPLALAALVVYFLTSPGSVPQAPNGTVSPGPRRAPPAADLPVPPGLEHGWIPAPGTPAVEGGAFLTAAASPRIARGDSHSINDCGVRPLAEDYVAAPDFVLPVPSDGSALFTVRYPGSRDFHVHLMDAGGQEMAVLWDRADLPATASFELPQATQTILAVTPGYAYLYQYQVSEEVSEPGSVQVYIPPHVTSFRVERGMETPPEAIAYTLTDKLFAVAMRGANPEADDIAFRLWDQDVRPLLGASLIVEGATRGWYYVLPHPKAPPTVDSSMTVQIMRRGEVHELAIPAPSPVTLTIDPPKPAERATIECTLHCLRRAAGESHCSLFAWPTGLNSGDQLVAVSRTDSCPAQGEATHPHAISCEVARELPDPNIPPPPAIGTYIARCVPRFGGSR